MVNYATNLDFCNAIFFFYQQLLKRETRTDEAEPLHLPGTFRTTAPVRDS